MDRAWILGLAILIRLSLLGYMLAANPSPVWPDESHVQLAHALDVLEGRAVPPRYADDFGLRYIHILLSPFGGPSLLRLQLLQILLDSLAVLLVWQIGYRLGGRSTAQLAAFLYAVFLPQAVLAVVPSYDVWATWALILPVWLILEGINVPRLSAVYGALAGFGAGLLSVVRSTTMLFAPAGGFALLFLWQPRLVTFVLTGWFTVALPLGAYKHEAFNEVHPVRGSMAHAFWVGVGQSANAYGVMATDESVYALYHNLSGRSDYDSPQYESFLTTAAFQYLTDHPFEYVANVAGRVPAVILPKNYWGPWIDQWHPTFISSLALLAASPLEFVFQHPITAAFGIVGRLMDWIILPFGFVTALIINRRRREPLVASLPLLYTIATLAPLYVTPRNTTNAYAAILPLCAFGLISVWRRYRSSFASESPIPS